MRFVEADDIKALRKELSCNAKELAAALGVEQKLVLSWEQGELFPTKRNVTKMEQLRKKGPDAIPRQPRGKNKKTGAALMADPRFWEVVRKLTAHPALFQQVSKLAEPYDDPADEK